MERIIRYAAYLFCALQIIASIILVFVSYGKDVYFAFLVMVPPIVCLIAMWVGPDVEEIRLSKQVRKASLRSRLKELEGK